MPDTAAHWMSQSRRKTSRLAAAASGAGGGRRWRPFEVFWIFLIFFLFAGSPPPDVGESHYLVKAKHYWDPAWCAGDLFLESRDAHGLFYWTFRLGDAVFLADGDGLDRPRRHLGAARLVVATAELGGRAAAALVAAVGRADAAFFAELSFGGGVGGWRCGGQGVCVCARVFGPGGDCPRSLASGAAAGRRGGGVSRAGRRLDGRGHRHGLAAGRQRTRRALLSLVPGGRRWAWCSRCRA